MTFYLTHYHYFVAYFVNCIFNIDYIKSQVGSNRETEPANQLFLVANPFLRKGFMEIFSYLASKIPYIIIINTLRSVSLKSVTLKLQIILVKRIVDIRVN